ncbi:hypothetical protein HDU96_009237 [Phlyctochytrium bullatum]|nr:hypothetical protein HDU96_009237 [Phlyctochytrium bullatum]
MQSNNDGNLAITYLSVAIDGALVLHKVMRYLDLEDHLLLFQTCSAFRRIIATETGPATARSIFIPSISKRPSDMHPKAYEIELKVLVRVMAFCTAAAAAVLTAPSECDFHDIFKCMCPIYEYGPTADLDKPPEYLWECCDDEAVLATMSRKRKRDLESPEERFLMSFFVTELLPELERHGWVSPDPSSLPPAFDFMPEPSHRNALGKALHQPNRADPLGRAWADELLEAAYHSGLDPLFDHLLLRYRPSFAILKALFRDACQEALTALAMRIIEVRGDIVDLADEDNSTLVDTVTVGHIEPIEFLLWIGRRGMDIASDDTGTVPVPWLQTIRDNFESLSRRPSNNQNFRVTLSGMRAAASHRTIVSPLYPRRILLRAGVANRNPAVIDLLVDTAGGWQAFLEDDVLHEDIVWSFDHDMQGAEDLLVMACIRGYPAVAKHIVEKIRAFLRHRSDLSAVDADDRITCFVTTLSICLVTVTAVRNSEDDSLSFAKCLLFEESETVSSKLDSYRRLVASPAFLDGMALQYATERGHEAVVALLLDACRDDRANIETELRAHTESQDG